MSECLFCKICKKQVPSDIIYEDEELLAFMDIEPQAPLHFLIVPKAHMVSAAALTEDEGPILGRVFSLAARISAKNGYPNGYRIVTNIGEDGGQSVPHLHFHVLAGRKFAWPPG